MTVVGPLLFGLMLIIPFWLATVTAQDKVIEIVDESGFFKDKFESDLHTSYIYLSHDLSFIKKIFIESKHDGLLYIPKIDPAHPKGIIYYSKTNTSLEHLNKFESIIKSQIERIRMEQSGFNPAILDSYKVNLSIRTINLTESEEAYKNTAAATTAGLFGAILIYFFIFLYGTQVMRGVIEEKTNRIVEVIITSVKPFELMMGKIIGIALVALTQFMLWIVLSTAISAAISSKFEVDRFSNANLTNTLGQVKAKDIDKAIEMNAVITALDSLNVPVIFGGFIFYFLLGYLLYSALFAAIGSAVDNETDTQQFMFPITIPLVMGFIFAQTVIREPDSAMAFWLSIIPFTSPIIMMVRLPFGVPTFDLVLSMGVLLATFLTFTWLAGRIYKVGILMYGKKPTYKEIGKWVFYK